LLESGTVVRVSVDADPVDVLITWVIGRLIDSSRVGVVGTPHKEDVRGTGAREDVSDVCPCGDELSGGVAVHIPPGVPCSIEFVKGS